MKSTPVKLDAVVRFIGSFVLVSITATLIHLRWRHIADVRGVCGALGFMGALLGTGTALWMSLRLRDRRFYALLLLAVLPMTYWSWDLYRAVHE